MDHTKLRYYFYCLLHYHFWYALRDVVQLYQNVKCVKYLCWISVNSSEYKLRTLWTIVAYKVCMNDSYIKLWSCLILSVTIKEIPMNFECYFLFFFFGKKEISFFAFSTIQWCEIYQPIIQAKTNLIWLLWNHHGIIFL